MKVVKCRMWDVECEMWDHLSGMKGGLSLGKHGEAWGSMGTGRELWDVAGIEDGVKSGDGGRMSLAMWECG